MPEPFFPLGASYYPPHHDPADWPRDVANMAAAGMKSLLGQETPAFVVAPALTVTKENVSKVKGRWEKWLGSK